MALGSSCIAVKDFSLMGIWDHFYNNSALEEETSTDYVNLSHCAELQLKLDITLDSQHSEHNEFRWFDLSMVDKDEKFYFYVCNYAI